MLNNPRSYEEACRTFRWRIPDPYNLAFDLCDSHTLGEADGHRTALMVEHPDGQVERYTFHVLRRLSNRLANALSAAGLAAGDRVALALPAGVEAAVSLLAVLRLGGLVVPLPPGLGAEPMAWRLADSGAKVLITDPCTLPALDVIRPGLDRLEAVILTGDTPPAGGVGFWAVIERAADVFSPCVTEPDSPAFVFYPIDGAGQPPGIVQAHQAMLGALPAIVMALGLFPQFGDVAWTPAEWMSAEALFRLVLPAWHHGITVVATPGRFDPGRALDQIGRLGIRVGWIPSDVLVPLIEAAGNGRVFARPRALASGPDPLSGDLHDRALRAFGIHVNESWGPIEIGPVVANLAGLMDLRPPSPGRAAPGLSIEAVDERGRILRAGERGILALSPGAPGGFVGYWGEADGPARYVNGWLLTGRLGSRDLDGYVWPEPLACGETEAIVSGRRVRLEQIEETLARHPTVAAAGVVTSDGGDLRAFVVPSRRGKLDVAALRVWVALHRGAAEVPRWIEPIDQIPLTVDGSVIREELQARPLRIDAPTPEDRWQKRRR